MTSCEATGPCAIICLSRLRASSPRCRRSRFCGTPCETKNSADDDRDRQQDVERARGQIDPEVADAVCAERRAKPRTSATASAMPVAAETKLCTVEPGHLRRGSSSSSRGTYDCQLVLVVKLTAVLKARSGSTAAGPAG